MLTALVVAGLLTAGSSPEQLTVPAGSGQPAGRPSEPFSTLFSPAAPAPAGPAFAVVLPAAPNGGDKGVVYVPETTRRDGRARTKVVCGMTLLIVGSEPDPDMVKPRPDSGTKYAIRRVPPRVCGQEK